MELLEMFQRVLEPVFLTQIIKAVGVLLLW